MGQALTSRARSSNTQHHRPQTWERGLSEQWSIHPWELYNSIVMLALWGEAPWRRLVLCAKSALFFAVDCRQRAKNTITTDSTARGFLHDEGKSPFIYFFRSRKSGLIHQRSLHLRPEWCLIPGRRYHTYDTRCDVLLYDNHRVARDWQSKVERYCCGITWTQASASIGYRVGLCFI